MRSATNSSAEQKDPSVLHRNAPLSVEGRHRLVQGCKTRPIAHVAAGLLHRPSVPHRQPTATPAEVVARVKRLRRNHKHSARRIVLRLEADGVRARATAAARRHHLAVPAGPCRGPVERAGRGRRRDVLTKPFWAPGKTGMD
jgi:hypothetical protein